MTQPSAEAIRQAKEQLLYEKNLISYGAGRRGGFTSVELEEAAEYLKRQQQSQPPQSYGYGAYSPVQMPPPNGNAGFGSTQTTPSPNASGDRYTPPPRAWTPSQTTAGHDVKRIYIKGTDSDNYRAVNIIKDYDSNWGGKSFIPFKMAKEIGAKMTNAAPKVIVKPDGAHQLTCNKIVLINWAGLDNLEHKTQFYVLPGGYKRDNIILGKEFLNKFGNILTNNFPQGRMEIAEDTE